MKKKFYPMLLIAALSLSACTDVTEPTVDYGGNTFINDYSALVDAVNNLNKTLKERFDALNTLLRDGMADIKVAVEANTGAITILSENTKNGLKDINTSLFNGFEALSLQMTTLTGQITAQGEAIVYAMNQNGEILRLQIDTTGKLISAQILASGNALVDVINSCRKGRIDRHQGGDQQQHRRHHSTGREPEGWSQHHQHDYLQWLHSHQDNDRR